MLRVFTVFTRRVTRVSKVKIEDNGKLTLSGIASVLSLQTQACVASHVVSGTRHPVNTLSLSRERVGSSGCNSLASKRILLKKLALYK